MSFENTFLGKKLSHIYQHYLPYWNGLNILFFTIVGILFSLNSNVFWDKIHSNKLGWIILAITIASSIWHTAKQVSNSKTIEELEKLNKNEISKLTDEKEKLDFKIQRLENQISEINNNSIEIVEIHLAYLFEKMSFNNDERITLYKFINDKFYVLGRYSSNPELKKRGRSSYKKEGLIFKAWQETKFFKNNGVPKADKRRGKFKSGYYRIINELAPINEETLWNIKMKSRSFYIRAFKDLNNLEQTSIIVIESIKDNAFEEKFIDSRLNNYEEKRLVAFVDKIDWDFPNINKAKEKGF